MEEQPSQTSLNASSDELVRYLRDDKSEPVEASVNRLVSLTMSAGYRVTRLKIDPAALTAGNRQPLEQAVSTAFNIFEPVPVSDRKSRNSTGSGKLI